MVGPRLYIEAKDERSAFNAKVIIAYHYLSRINAALDRIMGSEEDWV